jgi:hypothetical protein
MLYVFCFTFVRSNSAHSLFSTNLALESRFLLSLLMKTAIYSSCLALSLLSINVIVAALMPVLFIDVLVAARSERS